MIHSPIAVRRQLSGQERSSSGQVTESRKAISAANPALCTLSCARRVLLLQGPVGPFFDRLALWLRAGDAQVDRIAFQGGDRFDSRNVTPIEFAGSLQSWPAFLRAFIAQGETDCIVLFGQSRAYHRAAIDIAAEMGLPVVVLEEGYFRPGFVTIELDGVNGYSTTLRKFVWQPSIPSAGIAAHASPRHFQKMVVHACNHYLALYRSRGEFQAYTHHRGTDLKHYATYWLRSWALKYAHARHDLVIQRKLFESGQRYFFVPLQFDGDAQITQHSRYPENVHFIFEVLRSFATHAPEADTLVFKQHPHARGGLSHANLIGSLAQELGMRKRVLYLVEGDTPDLAEHSAGVVLINSTVGFQALERNAPLMVMGEAIYKRAELTHQGKLDDFWTNPFRPERAEVESFLLQVKNLTQAPASVYANRDEPLNWPKASSGAG